MKVLWESVLCANHFKLDNLFIIVDRNNFQQTGENKSIMDLKNLKSKFKKVLGVKLLKLMVMILKKYINH